MSRPLLGLVEANLVAPDLALEFACLGWDVRRLAPASLGMDAFHDFVRFEKPRAVVSINHSPELAWLCSREDVVYASWTVDPLPLERLRVIDGTRQDLVRVFLHRSSQVPLFGALGFASVEWLPLAAPRRRFEQSESVIDHALPPSFAGSSLLDEHGVLEQALVRWGVVGRDAETLRDAFDEFALAALDDPAFAGFPPGGQGIPARLLEIAGEPAPLVAEAVNARMAAAFRRSRVRDLAGLGCVVHGDGGWSEIVGGAWKGALADGVPLTRLYAGSLANVDVPRLHQRDIATLRAFDVAASGGCLLAEPSADLVRLLEPGVHFLPYVDGASLREALGRLRREPALSSGIGREARRHALERHRLEERAERILRSL